MAAAGVLAVLSAHVVSSRTVVVDVPLVFFATLALQAVYDVWRDGGRRAVIRCGVWIGLAAGCKYTGALLLAPFVVAWVLQAHRDDVRWGDMFRMPDLYVGAVVSGAVFLLTSPYCVLDFQGFWKGFSYERVHMAQGHFGVDATLVPVAYAQDVARNFGVWLTPFLLLGVGMRLVRMRRALQWLPFLVFVSLYLAIISTWSMRAGHYLLPVFPCLALFAAQGVWDFSDLVGRIRPLPGWASAGLLCGLLVLPVGIATGRQVVFTSSPDNRSLARAWIESHVAPGCLLVKEPYTPSLEIESPDHPTSFYWTVIPMDAVYPERSGPYYDLGWYADFDYVVTSQGVAERYLTDPERFEKQVRFYRDLETTWTVAAEFSHASGPAIRIFRNPEDVARRSDAPLDPELYRNLAGANTQLSVRFLTALGKIYNQKGWPAKEAGIYLFLTRLNPADPMPHTLLGNLLYTQGDLDAAVGAWANGLQADSTQAVLYLNIGAVHFRKGDMDRAVAIWEKGRGLDPQNPDFPYNLAALYQRQGRLGRAVDVLNEALTTTVQDANLYVFLGKLYEAQGHRMQAIDAYRNALRLTPNWGDLNVRIETLVGDSLAMDGRP